MTTIPLERILHPDDYNWNQVFAYSANEDRSGNGCGLPEPAVPGLTTSLAPFDRADVAELYGCVDGDHEGPDWIAYGKLKDGRYFSIAAGCDYTGWD